MKFKFYQLAILAFVLVGFVSFAKAQSNSKTSPYPYVADLTFTVGRTSDDKNYLVKAEAQSKGTLIKLFRFSFLQNIESTIDNDNFTILRTVKRDEQGDRIRNSEATFDYAEKRVTYIETDPKDAARPPRRIASSIEDKTYDLISGTFCVICL
jgi:hypothetical protein